MALQTCHYIRLLRASIILKLHICKNKIQFLSLYNEGCTQDGGTYAKTSNVFLTIIMNNSVKAGQREMLTFRPSNENPDQCSSSPCL